MTYRIAIFLLFFTSLTYSQNYSIKGVVKSSNNEILPFASVIAKPVNESKKMIYCVTDDNGNYVLKNLTNNVYIVTISYLGYETRKQKVLLENDKTINFILKEKVTKLGEVVIESPITVKEDTIVYDVKSFVKGNEKKLKNILEQLPGLEVDRKGNLKLNGKKVNQLFVNGRLFFGGNTKLGVNNIPANVVDKIQFIDNYNNVSFLKKVYDSDKMIINIKLKKEKTQFIFGDIDAGLGNKLHYRNHNTLFFYKPKVELNLISDINDTGDEVFSIDDFLIFQGGLNTVFKDGFSGLFKRVTDYSSFLTSQNNLFSNNKFAALNASVPINKKMSLRAYVIYSDTKAGDLVEQNNRYADFAENINTITNFDNSVLLLKFSMDYLKDKNTKIFTTTKFKSVKKNYNRTIVSNVNQLEKNMNADNNNNTSYFNENIEFHKELSARHILSSYIDFSYNKNNNNNHWGSDNTILSTLVPINIDTRYHLIQYKASERTTANVMLKHFFQINELSQLYTTFGNNFENIYYKNKDYQLMSSGAINHFDNSNFNNHLKARINTLFLGIQYKFKLAKVILKPGVFIHHYNWFNNIQSNNKTVLLPSLSLKMKLRKSQIFKFKYNLKSNFIDLVDLTNKYQLYSYNSISKGNPYLENELSHNFNLRYNRSSFYKGYYFTTEFNYNKNILGFISSIEFQDADYYFSKLLYRNASYSWSYFVEYTKRIKKLKLGVKTMLKKSNYIDNVASRYNTNANKSLNLGLILTTLKYKDYPTIKMQWNMQYGMFSYSEREHKYYNSEFVVNINYVFKNLEFNADYNYNYIKSLGSNYSYDLGNASLLYQKKNSLWTFGIVAKNIFDVKYTKKTIVSDYIISSMQRYINPISVLFSVNYKL